MVGTPTLADTREAVTDAKATEVSESVQTPVLITARRDRLHLTNQSNAAAWKAECHNTLETRHSMVGCQSPHGKSARQIPKPE